MVALFTPHPLALQTAFSEIKRRANEQSFLLIGTSGSVGERKVKGRRFLDAPLDTVVLGREGIVPVRVPRPERFAWHKLGIAPLRAATSEKRSKDLAPRQLS